MPVCWCSQPSCPSCLISCVSFLKFSSNHLLQVALADENQKQRGAQTGSPGAWVSQLSGCLTGLGKP